MNGIDDRLWLPGGIHLYNGQYFVQRLLGAGPFGAWYAARDVFLNRPVYIKEFFPMTMASRCHDGRTLQPTDYAHFMLGLEAFKASVRSVGRISHENIMPVLDLFEEYGTAYYVVPGLDGVPLSNELAAPNLIDGHYVSGFVLQVISGLTAAYNAGIFHGALKPSNIFVDSSVNVRLFDFGLMKTRACRQVYLPIEDNSPYLPLEYYRQSLEYGASADIYSCGAIFYRLLTGRDPDGQERFGRNGPRPSLYSNMAPVTDKVVGIAMSASPARRFRGPADMKFALVNAGLNDPSLKDVRINTSGGDSVGTPARPESEPSRRSLIVRLFSPRADEVRSPLTPDVLVEGEEAGQFQIRKLLSSSRGAYVYEASGLGRNDSEVIVIEYCPEEYGFRTSDGISVDNRFGKGGRFRAGVAAFARLASRYREIGSHENLAKVLAVFEQNGTAYAVLSHVKGVPLSQWVGKGRSEVADASDISFVMQSILNGLFVLHRRGLCHLGIRPERIVFDAEGNVIIIPGVDDIPEIGKKLEPEVGGRNDGFSAPELYKKSWQSSVSIDMYSCGALLYFILTGRTPPDPRTRNGDRELWEQLSMRGVTQSTVQVIRQAMSVRPGARYPNTGIMADELYKTLG